MRRRWAHALAGPVLIVGSVAVLERGFLIGRLTTQHPDLLAFWLPTYCRLGTTLRAGHIPTWNPSVMGGVPFAADPQSGWMYLPAMALFTALPCGTALGIMVALQPMLAGLGLFAFLRAEGLTRPAATVGGLALAVPLASSRLGLFLPFPASLAWTALLLAAASRLVRTTTWPSRLLWAGLAGVAWGQLAAAHAGLGLVVGTMALVAYLCARLAHAGRHGPWKGLAVDAGLLAAATIVLNLAEIVPRLAYLPSTSYGENLGRVAQLNGREPGWPLHLGSSPGLYLGAAVLGLAFAGVWSARHRAVVVAVGTFGLLSYVLSLGVVADRLAGPLEGVPVLDLYRHYPGRFVLGTLMAIPVLGAAGVDALLESRSGRRRVVMAAPGVAVWLVLPPLAGLSLSHRLLLLAGAAAAAATFTAAIRRPALAAMLPVMVAIELTANGLLGQASPHPERDVTGDLLQWVEPLQTPRVHPSAYLRPGPLVDQLRAMDSGRFLSLDPPVASARGYLTRQSAQYWGLLANQRAMLFGLEDAQGYNPFQLDRYWRFVRKVSPIPLDYNAAVFVAPPPVALDLLQVGWIVGPQSPVGTTPGTPVAGDGAWVLYRLDPVPPRAQVITSWTVIDDQATVLNRLTAAGFDPSAQVLLDRRDPGLAPSAPGSGGTATYRPIGDQAASIDVTASAPALVLVRTVYAPGWHAEVDGHPVPVLAADGLVQAVPVPAGHHVVMLRYHDPSIGYGAVGSLAGLVLMTGTALAAARLKRRT